MEGLHGSADVGHQPSVQIGPMVCATRLTDHQEHMAKIEAGYDPEEDDEQD